MDISTLAFDIAKITFAFLGTLFLGVPIWLKFGRHKSLLVTVPAAVALFLTVKNEMPLVTGFTPEVIGAVIVSHIAITGIIAALIYPSTKARLKKQLAEKSKQST